jgi:hypothetical protein
MRVDFCETEGCGMELDDQGRCWRCRERHWAELAYILRERIEEIQEQRLKSNGVDIQETG